MNPGVFTTIKVKQGIPLFFEEHKKRLLSHAKALHIPQPKISLTKITDYLKKNKKKDCALRVIITDHGMVDIVAWPLPKPSNVSLLSIPDARDENKIYKTTDRSENEKAMILAHEQEANDAIFTVDKKIIEATKANIFSLNENGDIITPPLERRGLKGIARKIIMKTLPVIEEDIPENTTAPLVLTNSLRVQKATHLNGKKLQDAEKLFQKIKTVIQKTEKEYVNNVAMKQLNNQKNIYYKLLKNWVDPEEIFVKLFASAPSSFWLDSSLTNKNTRFSYMGTPSEIITYKLGKKTTTVQKNKSINKINQNIFDYLEQRLKDESINSPSLPFPFIGGFVGYFGYELKKLTGSKFSYQSPYPDSLWFYSTKTVVFDHKERKIYLVCITNYKNESDKWFTETQNALTNKTKSKILNRNDKKITFKLDRNYQQYLNDIKQCKEFLARGESYQICLTDTFSAKAQIEPLTLYLNLRKTNPAPYASFIKHDDLAILSSSPEEFLKIDNRFIETKPIKGTIRRGEYDEEDKKLIKQLSASKKDWSENAMIVDLLRNDLGKICEFGSVKVSQLMNIESYKTVHQLVSTVTGKLQKEASLIDCIRAAFPGGSMTGTPKIHTLEIIDSLERKARGIYSGALGFLSLNKKAILNIVIRTIVINRNELTIGAGGAILIDSDPQKEYEEMLLKANVLIQTVTSLYNPAMHTIYLALGSNVGDKKAYVSKAIELLGEKIKNISLAKLYETKPMYYENQDTFLNSALKGETDLSPQELLTFVKQIEKTIGRKKRFPNGPREIDIDILFYDNLHFQNEHVQIPHPRIQERDFVLKPLMDIDPDLIHPVLKKTIKKLSEEL